MSKYIYTDIRKIYIACLCVSVCVSCLVPVEVRRTRWFSELELQAVVNYHT